MQRHHLNPPTLLDTLGLGFLSSSKNIVIWEPIKADSPESYFQFDQLDSSSIFLSFSQHQQKTTSISYLKLLDIFSQIGGFFIALQSSAIFIYFVLLKGTIKK